MATAKKDTNAFDGFTALDTETFKDGYEKLAKGFSTLAEFNKESADAFMKSAGVFGKGFETAATTQASFAKESLEDGVAAAKAVAGTKSVQEVMELQSDYLRSAVEKNVSHATKLAEIWSGVAKDAADPISKRYSEFVEFVQTYRP
ncbi:MAG: phasin family protein [Parvularculaceae bacterium]